MDAQLLRVPSPPRLRDLRRQHWAWLVQSYDMETGAFMLETVHKDAHSRDMELAAAYECGRWTLTIDLAQFDPKR